MLSNNVSERQWQTNGSVALRIQCFLLFFFLYLEQRHVGPGSQQASVSALICVCFAPSGVLIWDALLSRLSLHYFFFYIFFPHFCQVSELIMRAEGDEKCSRLQCSLPIHLRLTPLNVESIEYTLSTETYPCSAILVYSVVCFFQYVIPSFSAGIFSSLFPSFRHSLYPSISWTDFSSCFLALIWFPSRSFTRLIVKKMQGGVSKIRK